MTPKEWKGPRMCNRKLGFPALYRMFSPEMTLPVGVPLGTHMRNWNLRFGCFSFHPEVGPFFRVVSQKKIVKIQKKSKLNSKVKKKEKKMEKKKNEKKK